MAQLLRTRLTAKTSSSLRQTVIGQDIQCSPLASAHTLTGMCNPPPTHTPHSHSYTPLIRLKPSNYPPLKVPLPPTSANRGPSLNMWPSVFESNDNSCTSSYRHLKLVRPPPVQRQVGLFPFCDYGLRHHKCLCVRLIFSFSLKKYPGVGLLVHL